MFFFGFLYKLLDSRSNSFIHLHKEKKTENILFIFIFFYLCAQFFYLIRHLPSNIELWIDKMQKTLRVAQRLHLRILNLVTMKEKQNKQYWIKKKKESRVIRHFEKIVQSNKHTTKKWKEETILVPIAKKISHWFSATILKINVYVIYLTWQNKTKNRDTK